VSADRAAVVSSGGTAVAAAKAASAVRLAVGDTEAAETSVVS
jgi:hypothetical protein